MWVGASSRWYQPSPAPPRPGRANAGDIYKNFPLTLKVHLEGVPQSTPIEIWFQDEARIGQKNGVVRQWAVQRARYMTLETIAPLSDNPIVGLPAVAT